RGIAARALQGVRDHRTDEGLRHRLARRRARTTRPVPVRESAAMTGLLAPGPETAARAAAWGSVTQQAETDREALCSDRSCHARTATRDAVNSMRAAATGLARAWSWRVHADAADPLAWKRSDSTGRAIL